MHTLLDLRGNIRRVLSTSRMACRRSCPRYDLAGSQPSTSWIVYVEFARLYVLHQAGAFFVTRAKSNSMLIASASSADRIARPAICEQTISLDGFYQSLDYPELLRRIRFVRTPSPKTLVFNQQLLASAATISALQITLAGGTLSSVAHLRPQADAATARRVEDGLVSVYVGRHRQAPRHASVSTLCYRFSATPFRKSCPCVPSDRCATNRDSIPGIGNRSVKSHVVCLSHGFIEPHRNECLF